MAHPLNLRSAFTARWTIIPVTSLAMLLPLPAHCLGCAASAGNCPRCAEGDAAASSARHAPPACCQRHAAPADAAADVATDCIPRSLPGCKYCARPVHRTLPSAEQLLPAQELVSTLLLPAYVSARLLSAYGSHAATTLADLPPPIPHRILHCSWII